MIGNMVVAWRPPRLSRRRPRPQVQSRDAQHEEDMGRVPFPYLPAILWQVDAVHTYLQYHIGIDGVVDHLDL